MRSKYAEIYCPECKVTYKICFETKDLIPQKKYLICPICGYKNGQVIWLDGNSNGSNNKFDKKSN